MNDNMQTRINRTIGLVNVDLSSLTDLDDIIPHVASSCPDCTVSDLNENLGTTISRVEEALARLKSFKCELDAKPPTELVLVTCMDQLEGSFLFEENECGSSLGWLLRTVIDEHRAGNAHAVARFVAAQKRLHEVYVSDAGNNLDNPYNTLSDMFDAYAEDAEKFVKGVSSALPSYADFIRERENNVAH